MTLTLQYTGGFWQTCPQPAKTNQLPADFPTIRAVLAKISPDDKTICLNRLTDQNPGLFSKFDEWVLKNKTIDPSPDKQHPGRLLATLLALKETLLQRIEVELDKNLHLDWHDILVNVCTQLGSIDTKGAIADTTLSDIEPINAFLPSEDFLAEIKPVLGQILQMQSELIMLGLYFTRPSGAGPSNSSM